MLHFFLHHRTSTAVTILLLLAGGVWSLAQLPFALLPGIQHPSLVVSVSVPPDAPAVIEQAYIVEMEQRLKTLDGLTGVRSSISGKGALLELSFTWGSDLDLKFLLVKDRLEALVAGKKEVSFSIYRNLRGVTPSTSLVVTQKQGGSYDVRFQDWVRFEVLPRLTALKGVQTVDAVGLNEVGIDLQVRTENLHRQKISAGALVQHVSAPEERVFQSAIREGAEMNRFEVRSAKVQAFTDTALGFSIPLDTLVQVRETVRFTSAAQYNGRPAVQLDMYVLPSADLQGFSALLDSNLTELLANEPGYEAHVVRSALPGIQAAKTSLLQSVLTGIVLSTAVLFIFLGSVSRSAAIFISVPVSFSVTFLSFYALGIPLNLVSVASLILSSGVIIDNAIIIIESMEQRGEDIRDLVLPLSASTFTNIGVFIPFFFLQGFERALFRDLMVGYTVSMLGALVVGLLFTPPLVLMLKGKHTKKTNAPIGDWIFGVYHRAFLKTIRRPAPMVIVSAGLIVAGAITFYLLDFRFLPQTKRDTVEWEISPVQDQKIDLQNAFSSVNAVISTALTETKAISWLLSGGIPYLPDFDTQNEAATLNVTFFVSEEQYLEPLKRSLQQRGFLVREKAASNPLADLLFHEKADFRLIVEHPVRPEFARLRRLTDSLRVQFPESDIRMANVPGAHWVLTPRDSVFNLLRLPEGEARNALSLLAGEPLEWTFQGKTRSARLLFYPTTRLEELPLEVAGLPYKTSSLYTVSQQEEYSNVQRKDGIPVTIFDAKPDVFQQAGLPKPSHFSAQKRWISGFSAEGRSVQSAEFSALIVSLMTFSFLIMLLVLLAQFEHFGYTILILLSIPVSWTGSALFLWASGQAFSLYALLGMVVVTGISVNDSILKVAHFQDLRKSHRMLRAVSETSESRFRPVVMTTLTTIMAMVPVLFAEPDINPFFGTAVVIIGGLLFSTLQSLFLLPLLLIKTHTK